MESNTFSIYFPNVGVRVLVDPWLRGTLTFSDNTALFEAKKTARDINSIDLDKVVAEHDFILLT